MKKAKRFTIGAGIFYVWYVYTGAVYQFADFCATGALYKILKISAPLMWLGGEGAASVLFVFAPILFLAATVIIDLLPEFTKAQKIVLTAMPIVSYALFWGMECIANTYFRHGAFR